jgi:hypothetical protein
MESISEAFNKCFVADFIICLSRTIRDKNANIGRLFVAKNRNGPDAIIYSIFMDTGSVTIKVLEREEVETVRREQEASRAKKDMSNARKIFKQMKKDERKGEN